MSIGEILYELTEAKEPFEVLNVWTNYNHILKDYKLIINIEKYNNIFPPNLLNSTEAEDTDLISYFPTGNLIFVDNENIEQMILNDTVDIKWDYSIMLDTNYTSYIEKFINNEMDFHLESVYKTLDILLQEDFNYDYTFYLIENYANIFESGSKMYSIKNAGHIALYKNLFSLEKFKSIDSAEYKKNKNFIYQLEESEAHLKTSTLITNLLGNENSLESILESHKAMTLFLIGVWKIQFDSKASAKNKIKKLMDFVTQKVGIYFEREFMIAYKYFEKNNSISMLNKINKGGKHNGLLDKIENIAWDFMIPRIMEIHMANGKSNYFIPFILSHDKKLKELLKQFEVKGFLYHKNNFEFYPISLINTTEFFEEKGLLDEIMEFGKLQTQKERRKTMERNRKEGFKNIENELKSLESILKSS
ncbi:MULTISPECIES: hypothetical protein [unclassified Lysinibacillus]|uniref:hypothetical protein n=1 Tax=unclassified Lysinibacillus TaxID=2636778 RepID=UPI003822EBF9